jgi:transposase
MTYCYKCPECGFKMESSVHMEGALFLCPDEHVMDRDWGAEAANVNIGGLH